MQSSVYYKVSLVGVMLFAVLLPVTKSGSSIVMGGVYAVCLIGLIADADFRKSLFRALRQPLFFAVALYAGIAGLGLLISQDMREGISIFKRVANLPAVYLMAAGLLDISGDDDLRRKQAERLLLSFVAGVCVLDGIGLLEYAGMLGDKAGRLPLTPLGMHHIWFGNLNAIGLYAAASLCAYSAQYKRRLPRLVMLAGGALGALSVFLSLSRTAWAGMAAAAVVSGVFLVKRRRMAPLAFVAVCAASLVMYAVIGVVRVRVDQAFSEVSLFFSNDAATSIGHRFLMWKAALQMFLSHPFFGVGTGDYSSTIAVYVGAGRFPDLILKYNQPHNMYLFSLAVNGVAGFAALIYLFCRSLVLARRLIGRQEHRLLGLVAVAVSVHFLAAGLTESLFTIHVLICSFALIMGVCERSSGVLAQGGPQ